MKKFLVLGVLAAFAAGVVLVSNDNAVAARAKKDKEETSEASKDEPKVMYKFKNAEEMTEFEQLYIAKQATFGRMGVLQAYFAMEQNNLQQIDAQMESKFGFKMDPNNMYDLNREDMEIKELGPAQIPQAAQPAE